MPIDLSDQAIAILDAMTEDDLKALAPAKRRRLANQLVKTYRMIEGDRIISEARAATAPKEGVLACLHRGDRAL